LEMSVPNSLNDAVNTGGSPSYVFEAFDKLVKLIDALPLVSKYLGVSETTA
jgi:hypothetical protein